MVENYNSGRGVVWAKNENRDGVVVFGKTTTTRERVEVKKSWSAPGRPHTAVGVGWVSVSVCVSVSSAYTHGVSNLGKLDRRRGLGVVARGVAGVQTSDRERATHRGGARSGERGGGEDDVGEESHDGGGGETSAGGGRVGDVLGGVRAV